MTQNDAVNMFTGRLKCPKCGSENYGPTIMPDDRRVANWCGKCGHEEKVEGEK